MNSKIEKFEDLGVWKESISLATEIYTILVLCQSILWRVKDATIYSTEN